MGLQLFPDGQSARTAAIHLAQDQVSHTQEVQALPVAPGQDAVRNLCALHPPGTVQRRNLFDLTPHRGLCKLALQLIE
jgi:hypothetical protein